MRYHLFITRKLGIAPRGHSKRLRSDFTTRYRGDDAGISPKGYVTVTEPITIEANWKTEPFRKPSPTPQETATTSSPAPDTTVGPQRTEEKPPETVGAVTLNLFIVLAGVAFATIMLVVIFRRRALQRKSWVQQPNRGEPEA